MNDTSSDKATESQYTFYPRHLLVEAVASVIVLVALVVAALLWAVPLDEMANPADTTYVPRPEWYFLFYFQMLKYFEGSLTVIGVFVLPMLVLGVLFCLPFFDRSEPKKLVRRPVAALCGVLGMAFVIGLTVNSLVEDSKNPRIFKKINFPPITQEQVAAGEKVFSSYCVLCHAMNGKGGFMAPDLTQVGGRTSRTYIENVIMNPQLVSQQTIMSLVPLSDAERHEVSAYLFMKK